MANRLGSRGPGHGSRLAATAGGGGGPVSAIATLNIMSATPLLDATSDYGDATSRTGVNGNGWVGRVTVPYLAGQTFDPTKISLVVSDPGYDGTGTTTVSRTITGRAVLRRQYTAQTSRQQSNDGVILTVYFSLSDDIYQGSTIVGGTAAASFYGASAAGSIASITNNSTMAYPKPLFAWLNLQHERVTGSGYDVEAVAFHKHARNGRQVARVEFIGADASAHTAATQTASSTSLSALQTQGNIAEAYKATIPLSGLTQADLCQVNAKVYPWIGDSSAVLDLAVDGVTWPTAQSQTRLRFLNDKTGTYGGAIAYVKVGASGGTVSLTGATARAAPFPTIPAAVAALVTFNNGRSSGHNDHSGSDIYLMDDGAGGAGVHIVAADINGAAGLCWTNIRPDPLATGAVSMRTHTSNNYGLADLIRFCCNIEQYHYFNSGVDPSNLRVAFDGVASFDTTNAVSDVPLTYRIGLIYQRNVTYTGTQNSIYDNLSGYSSTRTQCALALGMISENASNNVEMRAAHAIIGCRFKRHTVNPNAGGNFDPSDGGVIYNNWFRDCRLANFLLGEIAYSRGLAIIQNVFERDAVSVSISAINLGGDGASVAVSNVVMQHNTIPGDDSGCRLNVAYADVAGAAGVIKNVEMRFNLLCQYNCKTDTYTGGTSVTGRVGNWRRRYTVGDLGNVVLQGDTGSSSSTIPNPDGGSWLGEAWPAATYNVGAANVTFTDLKAGAGRAGSGVYSLTGGSNAAYAQVPAGLSVLAYDIAGVARKTDGAGAAGAYERP
jgi:hypothetical protein